MYTVSHGQEKIEIDTRDKAIKLARSLSDGNHRTVTIEDEEEKFVYRNGDLMQYLYDTRKR